MLEGGRDLLDCVCVCVCVCVGGGGYMHACKGIVLQYLGQFCETKKKMCIFLTHVSTAHLATTALKSGGPRSVFLKWLLG